MATVQFQKPSPFKELKREASKTDYKYTRYMKNVEGSHLNDAVQGREIINIALVGLGRAGLIHLKNIISNPNIHLKYVVEQDNERAQRIQRDNNLTSTILIDSSNFEQIINDESLHGVIIASPTTTHEDIVIKFLLGKKAVMCEKPISLTLEGTKNCYDIAKQMGKPLFVAFNRRFDPSFQDVFSQVRSGKVGRISMIKTVSRDSPLNSIDFLKISGGILHDCAVHDIDLICNILGEYPEKVLATGSAFIPEIKELNDYDTIAITMKFPSEAISMTDLSRNSAYGYDQRLEVFGSEGMIQAHNESPIQTSFSGISGQSKSPIYYSFPSRYFEAYNIELEHFCDLITGKAKPEITFENTFNVTKIAIALEQSLKTETFTKIEY